MAFKLDKPLGFIHRGMMVDCVATKAKACPHYYQMKSLVFGEITKVNSAIATALIVEL